MVTPKKKKKKRHQEDEEQEIEIKLEESSSTPAEVKLNNVYNKKSNLCTHIQSQEVITPKKKKKKIKTEP